MCLDVIAMSKRYKSFKMLTLKFHSYFIFDLLDLSGKAHKRTIFSVFVHVYISLQKFLCKRSI